ncbi:MAG: hypothetical protein ACTTKH_02510 [Treponema sp.]
MTLLEEKKEIDYQSLIYKNFGFVRRARGFYLYTEKKVRLLDMYLSDGRAILGHKTGRVVTTLKGELDKGLFGYFPSSSLHLLKRALKSFFPHYESFICSTKEKAFSVMKDVFNVSSVTIYRHFLEKDWGTCFLFLPYPSLHTSIILYKNMEKINLPKEDDILPAEAKAIACFIYDVIASKKRIEKGALVHSMCSKKLLKKETKIQKEIERLMPALKVFFDVEGRYLFFKGNDDEYKDFFMSAFEHCILLSPSSLTPSIFPNIENYSQLESFIKSKTILIKN